MPLAIDLFCGLGGWTEGLLAEGYRVVGYDIEAHEYDGERYPAELVLADVLTIHGSRFKDADLIVASPPCTEYSYMAMPWSRAKQIGRALRGQDEFPEGYTGSRTVEELNALFNASFRIQREACEAAGRHIPLVVENVRGAIPWVGRSRWNYGSFHLWGDVPALMPSAKAAKVPGFRFDGSGGSFQTASVNEIGIKIGGDWFSDPQSTCRRHGSKSPQRKAASARIAKIPLGLSRWIAAHYLPAPFSPASAAQLGRDAARDLNPRSSSPANAPASGGAAPIDDLGRQLSEGESLHASAVLSPSHSTLTSAEAHG